ncbi:hypothetical protein GOBAR_DD23965 [Gossypium barbadense]|nr:hypothetical protein GOBAR_DD23965 [Gossypium barbadense]
MENPESNQLPEVDSLPDGFVESPSEILAPKTPISKEEKPLQPDCREGDLVSSEFGANKGQKQRTFPVPLSEADGFEGSADYIEGIGRGSETNLTALKESSSSESIDLPKNKKTETTETKRKTAKRTSKSEKEFLEFSLKYQQVIAERDTEIVRFFMSEHNLCKIFNLYDKEDECKRVSTEGQNLRLDLSARFQDAIKDVSNKLEEQKDDCLSQLKENEMMKKPDRTGWLVLIRNQMLALLRDKLKELADQYALSEQQYAQKIAVRDKLESLCRELQRQNKMLMLKQKTLELQLSDLKIKQHEEKLTQEQAQMKVYAEQVSQLLVTEKNLRMQLTADGEKFQQFQDALSKSNEVFETFKQEIEKMAKSIKELRKENVFLKSKCDKSDFTLIELVEERERMKKQLEKTKNQKEKLESLCRSLQAERKQSSTGSSGSNSHGGSNVSMCIRICEG